MKKYEKVSEVPADVVSKASAALQEEVDKELEIEDPSIEVAKAVFQKKGE